MIENETTQFTEEKGPNKDLVKNPAEMKVIMEKDLVKQSLEGRLVTLMEVKGNWAIVKLGDTKDLESRLRCVKRVKLDQGVVVGQMCLVSHDSGDVIRVVVDHVSDGCVGVHGVDQIFYHRYPDQSSLLSHPDSLTITPALCHTVKLNKHHQLGDQDLGDNFTVQIIGAQKHGYDVVELIKTPSSTVFNKQ